MIKTEENNTILWARKIFKTKPNKNISEEFKSTIKTIFHHLTKEELIAKLIADQLHQASEAQHAVGVSKKKKKSNK